MRLLTRLKNLFGLKEKDLIGLDIGADKIKLAKVDTSQGQIKLTNLAIGRPPQNAIVDGKFKKVDELALTINNLLVENNFTARDVVASVSGEEVIIRVTDIPNIPKDELDEVIRWEANEQIPLPVDEMILDYEIVTEKSDGGYEIMLVAVKEEIISSYLEVFEQVGLNPVAIEIEPLAIARILKLIYPQETMAVVDIGSKTTDVSVFSHGKFLFTRSLEIGGDEITKDVADIYQLEMSAAEEYKKNNDLFEGNNLSMLIRKLTTSVYRSLDYFQVNYRDYEIGKLVLAGGGGRLINLDKHFKQEFGIEIERLDVFSGLEIDLKEESINKKELAPLIGVSVGLALRGGEA